MLKTQFSSEDKISLLEFLNPETVVWIKDWDVIKEMINGQEEYFG
jgi:transcription-repair coupling factor (superfamily II helicase)